MWDTFQSQGVKKYSMLLGGHGAGGTIPASTTYYVTPFVNGLSAIGNNAFIPITGVVKNLLIRMSGTQPASGSLVVTFFNGGGATVLSVTISAGAGVGTYQDAVNKIAYGAGDIFRIELRNNALAASAPISMVVCQFEVNVSS